MTEPTKSSGVLKMKTDDLIQTIESNAREELLAASAQSAEPQEAEAWDPLETLAAAVKVLWDDVRMIVTKDSACSRWHEDAILALAAIRARLASKPSREEAPCAKCTRCAPCGPPAWESYTETARPSREEEMREQIERIKHDCENALRSSTHHKCDYLSLIQSINDRLARAALAQGGARDEGREEGKR